MCDGSSVIQKENGSLHDISVERNGMLAEKTHLLRDLSGLQADCERLKAENDVLAPYSTEKKALERELRSAKTQLENEKSARESATAEVSRQAQEIAMVSGRLENAQRRLAVELPLRRERQQPNIEKNPERREKGEMELSRRQKPGSHGPHKRHNNPYEQAAVGSGLAIATPGAIQSREKAKKSSALPGEKSAFSITPFLNRTNSFHSSSTPSDEGFDELDNTSASESGTVHNATGISRDWDGARSPVQIPPHDRPTSNIRLFKPIAAVPRNDTRRESPERAFNNKRSLAPRPGKAKKRKLGAQRDRAALDEGTGDDTLEIRRPGGRPSIFGGLPQPLPRHNRGGLNLTAAAAFSPLKRDRRR